MKSLSGASSAPRLCERRARIVERIELANNLAAQIPAIPNGAPSFMATA
jgi:hypothetical protein